MRRISGLMVSLGIVALAGCAASPPPKYDWTKEGASDHDKVTVKSECTYQVKLNKVSVTEKDELVKLCMQSKGYRYKRVG